MPKTTIRTSTTSEGHAAGRDESSVRLSSVDLHWVVVDRVLCAAVTLQIKKIKKDDWWLGEKKKKNYLNIKY